MAKDWFPLFLGGMVIGGMIMGILAVVSEHEIKQDISELGQAICDQEYKQDFVSYDTEEGLACEPRVAHYDGVKVRAMKVS